MGFLDKVVEPSRRTMVLFFVIDTSGSMNGDKIGSVNTAIEEVVPEIKLISEENADAQIKIAVLTFSTGAQWVYDAPIEAENFRYNYVNVSGVTDLGAACEQLDEKLSRNGFMSDVGGSFAPAIFLMSDGEPTDNYQKSLEKLKRNAWFKHAIKVAIGIGRGYNAKVLAEFTGTNEAVVEAKNPESLKQWIRFVSVRASEIGSKSSSAASSYTGNEPANPGVEEVSSKQGEMIDELQNASDEWDSDDWGDTW